MNIDNLAEHDLDILFPVLELELDDIPDADESLFASPVTLSAPLTINQTLYSERICIRINKAVLAILKQKAAERGTRYQTFINMLLAQHAATCTPTRGNTLEK